MFKAFFKLISNVWRRLTRRANEAGDSVYTGSAQGIADAYDDHRDTMVRQYQTLRDAISEVETVAEDQRLQLEALNAREKDKIELRDGALAKFEEAEAAGDDAAAAKWEDHYTRLSAEINEIEAEQATIEATLKQTEEAMRTHLTDLTSLQREIQNLPAEKAQEIAKFVSNSKLIELSDRLSGLKTSIDRGPLDAVRAQNRQLSAKAKIVRKLDGTDASRQDEELRQAGRKLSARAEMRAALEARKAEKAASTGEAPVRKEERPEI